ncbi:MerR family transcriptional regulator [Georgenia thermotolerans]|uniref:MerR family transcriptional regulator n=1 Tax=Georgenia thermotolerans TaxID=527326 RepID=A0A7J5US19_9MICO|nr:helix-turn-helix transcriptional regulator [Georgenia thermotolerans]KAE8765041.1 MerR family transcriptional regulator [Georgenia thermotolerans]
MSATAAEGRSGPAGERGVFGISVAAEMVGMDPQSLRLYERRGLLQPDRTPGGTRRYSADDVARLGRIGELLEAGLNLAGVAAVLGLEADNAELAADNASLTADNAELSADNAELAADNARLRAELGR